MLKLSYFDDSVKICVPVSGFEAQSAMTRGFQPICIPWLGRTLTRCSYDNFEYLLWAQQLLLIVVNVLCPAILINCFAFLCILVSTIDLLGPSQHSTTMTIIIIMKIRIAG